MYTLTDTTGSITEIQVWYWIRSSVSSLAGVEGVLVTISIPIFTAQLEKAREATDAANIRSAYAVVSAAALTEDSATDIAKNNTTGITYSKTGTGYQAVVTLKQQTDGWTATMDLPGKVTGTPSKGGTATVAFAAATNEVTITFNAAAGGGTGGGE